jgi:hypothetical protein
MRASPQPIARLDARCRGFAGERDAGSRGFAGSPLPDATADFVEAAARLAAAVARGDRAEARRMLEGALQAVDPVEAPALRVVR